MSATHTDPSDENNCVAVEFYGIARYRAGTSRITLSVCEPNLTLGGLWKILQQKFPHLGPYPNSVGDTMSPYSINLDGQRFINDAATVINPGQTVLIFSADAGG